MKSNYKNIFTPLTIKNMTMRNRIMMTPMGTNYGEQTGEMSFLHIDYYTERAKGGVVPLDPSGESTLALSTMIRPTPPFALSV